MSRFYIQCNKITEIKELPDFSPITSIGAYGLSDVLRNRKELTGSVSFPNLISIGESGLEGAFSDCTGLTGSVSFPSLTSVGSSGLPGAFSNCSDITEVHFKPSLSGNSHCTMSAMGCRNATVYFDL